MALTLILIKAFWGDTIGNIVAFLDGTPTNVINS